MSVLNQLFNRGLLGAKCKTCLTLSISRIKLLQNKRDLQLKLIRKEISQFLQAGQEPIARIRVEHVIREQNAWEAYEILEMFCEFVFARIPILESQRECPTELREAVASIIFSAPRCSDLPDLMHVRNLFAAKYGKEFVAAASELRPDTSIIEKLSVSSPAPEIKLKALKEIALEYNINWDSSKTETEFRRKPEDLLNGPKEIDVQTPTRSMQEIVKGSSSETLMTAKQSERHQQCPTSVGNTPTPVVPSRRSPEKEKNLEPITRTKKASSSDTLQRARSAIAAAERASAAARAAAQLVNADVISLKLEHKI